MTEEKTEYELAEEFFIKHDSTMQEELSYHHKHGWVIHVPYLFALGLFLEEDDKIILHVSYANGDIKHLMNYSFDNVIDKIQFERNGNGKPERYDFERFKRLVKNG
jgi:hypothetical protein